MKKAEYFTPRLYREVYSIVNGEVVEVSVVREVPRWRRSPRVRAVVRREYPLLGIVGALLCGQVVGGIPGWLPGAALVIGLVILGIGGWCRVERIILGALVVIVGIVTTLAMLPRAVGLPADAVWRGAVEEPPRYSNTGAVGLMIRAVALAGGVDGAEPLRLFCTAVDLPWRNIAGVERGDVFFFRAVLTPLEVRGNPFAYSNLLRRRGVSANCRITHATPVLRRERAAVERFRGVLERWVKRIVGSGEMWGLLLAMSIGARDTLSIETERAFKATGLSHLLVVSGFQVTLVYYLVSGAMLALHRRIGWLVVSFPGGAIARLVGLGASLGFVAVSGVDGSSLRAAFAAVCAVVARSLERGGGLFNGVVVSLLCVSLVWPGAVLEPGVELTYAALLGICLGRDIFPRRAGFRGTIGAAGGVTVGVWLLSSIVSLGWFRTFSPIGLILNPLLAPMLGVLGCHGTFVAFIASVSGLDSTGALLRAVGESLLVGRDFVVMVARSGVVVPELSPTVACGWAILLGVVSAHLLQRHLRRHFPPWRGAMNVEERDGVTESRLSERDHSATLLR